MSALTRSILEYNKAHPEGPPKPPKISVDKEYQRFLSTLNQKDGDSIRAFSKGSSAPVTIIYKKEIKDGH